MQVLDASGLGQDSDIIDGVVWAADHGADVILMSFSNPGFSPALQYAIDYAWSRAPSIVAATGNDGVSTPSFPAGDADVIGVSATDPGDALWSGSNYGEDTFLAAPGVDIETNNPDGTGTSVTGTSASAAFVAGAAALLKAKDPSASNGVIVGRLARNADAAGTAEQTGERAAEPRARDWGYGDCDPVTPVGAAPVGGGGPLVGPYVAATVGTVTVSSASQTPSRVMPGNSATFNVNVVNGSSGTTRTFKASSVSSVTGVTLSSSTCVSIAPSATGTISVTLATTASTPVGDDSFTLTVSDYNTSPCSGAINTSASGTGTLVVGPLVTLSLSGSPMAEAAVSNGYGDLVAASTLATTVNLSFSGTATGGGTDYTASGTSITIPASSTTGTRTLTAVQDTLDEANETIVVDVASVTNGTESGTQQVTGTITDDDPTPSLTLGLSGSPMAEAAGVATVTATLSAVSGQAVTVPLSFTGTATNTTDYTRSATSITIPAGSASAASR